MRIYDSGTYRDMTPRECGEMTLKITPQMRIEQLKNQLADTDYIAIKYAEGWIADGDYASTKELRQSWRDEINEIQEMLIDMEDEFDEY